MEEENKELLNEELKRFNSIMEYTFNLGEKEELLFDSLEEQEEEVTDEVDALPEEPAMEEPAMEEPAMDDLGEDPFGGDAAVEDEMLSQIGRVHD